jgi:CubicO group peptidase (beta-lactamase class C family)
VKRVKVVVFLLCIFVGSCNRKTTDDRVYIEPVSDRWIFGLSNDSIPQGVFGKFDKEISKFLDKWQIKGAAFGVMRNDSLLYARGFGYSDVEAGEAMQPYHMMRLASVSKLITGIAVLKLVEEGKLKLSGKVFGRKGYLNDLKYQNYVDKRVEQITVDNLLRHRAGWTSRWGDQMFMPHTVANTLKIDMPPSLDDIILFALGKKLHYKPGAYSSYSNLGYAILGKVIEKVSGMNYENYVREKVLAPIGIHHFYIGGNTLTERRQNEVKYYEQQDALLVRSIYNSKDSVLKSYGGNDIKCLGAAGGWIGNVPELLKLVASVNLDDGYPDMLSKESVETMVDYKQGYSPIGWRRVTAYGWWRTGTLAGTSALIYKGYDGLTWVFITNTSAWNGSRFPWKIYYKVNSELKKISNYPKVNMFEM